MIIVWGGKQTGKTMELIKYASQNKTFIVTENNDTRNEILERCKKLDIFIQYPLIYLDILNGKHLDQVYGDASFVIDNIENFLSFLLYKKVDMVSFSQVERVIHKQIQHETPDWKIEP